MSAPEDPDGKSLLGRIAARANDRVLDFVDPNVILDHVEVNELLDRVDVNRLLDRVDVDDLLNRVDINQLLDRVNVDALLERANVDALLERVDIGALVDRAGIPDIVRESTGRLTGSALDLFRRPIVGLDEIIFRTLVGLIGRDPNDYPKGPGALLTWVGEHVGSDAGADTVVKTGRYAGPLTRLLAFVTDVLVVTSGFTLIVAGVAFLIGLFVPDFALSADQGVWYAVSAVVWAFLYTWIGLVVFGKTVGKALLGARVVNSDGSPVLTGGQALIRAVTYPLSFLLFGIGLLGVVFNKERRAWHDHLAGTAVVYDWGSRTAGMPTPLAEYLRRRGADI